MGPGGNLVQYLTHDGDAVGNVLTSSAPNSQFWNTVLSVPWQRSAMGDWRDLAGTANGSVPYGSSATITAVGRYSISVTALVQRWRSNGLNRGFYLATKANPWPLIFAGRSAANAAERPTLTVVTTSGTFVLAARANAHWFNSSVSVVSSAARFELRAGQGPAILQFDLSSVSGTVSSATLSISLTALTQTGAVIDVFEADPPTLISPEAVAAPELGLAAQASSFAQLGTLPGVLFNDDMASPGPFDAGGPNAWAVPPTRTLNTSRGTTYARGTIPRGRLDSVSVRVDTTRGTGSQGSPDVVRPELFARYRFLMENTFGGGADRIKIPAIGSQFGWWNTASGGYWQSTTGNGGSRGTGLKVWNATQGKWEYQGHSTRLVTGFRASDASAYAEYMSVAVYAYNLDQTGPFPSEEVMRNVVLRRGVEYSVELRLKQNSLSGTQDANGNYATANADGVFEVWFNGYKAWSRTNYRCAATPTSACRASGWTCTTAAPWPRLKTCTTRSTRSPWPPLTSGRIDPVEWVCLSAYPPAMTLPARPHRRRLLGAPAPNSQSSDPADLRPSGGG